KRPTSTLRCTYCSKKGHEQRDCHKRIVNEHKALNRPSTSGTSSDLVAKVALNNDASVSPRKIFKLGLHDANITARLDTGADITVIDSKVLPTEFLSQSHSLTKLIGAF